MSTMQMEPAAPPRPGLVSLDGRAYPLESVQVEGRVEGGVAMTTLRQRYRNPYSEALEVLYTLPLPADGAVLGYVIVVGERRIVGQIQPREAAAEAYREALYEGRTAGLLEQERSDTFQQRLGNLPGGQEVEVEIQVLHPLAFRPRAGAGRAGAVRRRSERGGLRAEWEYRFPTTLGVRYMGAEGRVPDAEHLEPGRAEGGIPTRMTASILVPGHPEAGVGLGAVRSPSHRIRSRAVEEGIRIELEEASALDRDLVLRWPALAPHVGVRMVEGGGLEGDGGRYALLTILPPAAPSATLPRDLTLLLDTSGSMHGTPLELAKVVVDGLLGTLGTSDRVEILAFGSTVREVSGGMVAASPERVTELGRQLRRLRASGGTEMVDAVRRALRPLRRDAQRQVILVTDGYIGFEGEVVAEAMARLPEGVRFHAVGVGAAPNRTLTNGLARASRGVELFAVDKASARETVALLRQATDAPVVTDLQLSGSAVRQVAPQWPRDVLAHSPVVLTAELAPEGGAMEVSGHLAGERTRWRWTTEVEPMASRGAESTTTPLPVGALHGRERVEDLELQVAAGEPRGGVDPMIERTGLRHRIMTRRTSLVAISETVSVDPRAPRRRERLPVELPAGVSAEGVGLVGGNQVGMSERVHGVRSMRTHSMDSHLDADMAAEGLFEDFNTLFSGARESAEYLEDVVHELHSPVHRLEPHLPADLLHLDGNLLHLDGNLLVLELEVPTDGFELPEGELNVTLTSGETLEAWVDADWSSPMGPHSAGLRVRMAIRLATKAGRPEGGRIRISWEAVARSEGPRSYAVMIDVPPLWAPEPRP